MKAFECMGGEIAENAGKIAGEEAGKAAGAVAGEKVALEAVMQKAIEAAIEAGDALHASGLPARPVESGFGGSTLGWEL